MAPLYRGPFNTVVLPPEADGTMPVYFLTAQTDRGSFPFGGHNEIDVAPDGYMATARAFIKSCVILSEPSHAPGAQLTGLLITHLLDPQPTEIHIFE